MLKLFKLLWQHAFYCLNIPVPSYGFYRLASLKDVLRSIMSSWEKGKYKMKSSMNGLTDD